METDLAVYIANYVNENIAAGTPISSTTIQSAVEAFEAKKAASVDINTI